MNLLLTLPLLQVNPQAAAGVDPYVKDVVQMVSGAVALVVALITIWRAFHEIRNNREQRDRALISHREDREQRQLELRWRRAQAGASLVEKMLADKDAGDAMTMLDWSSRKFEIGDALMIISHKDFPDALRDSRGTFDAKEVFIRDVFDDLFFHLARFEQAVRVDLVTLDDVSLPISYYIAEMAKQRHTFEAYLRAFHPLALAFVERFPEWKRTNIAALPNTAQTA